MWITSFVEQRGQNLTKSKTRDWFIVLFTVLPQGVSPWSLSKPYASFDAKFSSSTGFGQLHFLCVLAVLVEGDPYLR